MDWAQHIKMDYAQNLKKDSAKAKKGHSQNLYRVLSAHFLILQYKEFAAISSNLIKTAIFTNAECITNDKINMNNEYELESNSNSDLHFFSARFSEVGIGKKSSEMPHILRKAV